MKTYLQITLKVADKNREAAAGVYTKYKNAIFRYSLWGRIQSSFD